MSNPKEQIIAALKKLGASGPTALANATGDAVSKVSYHLRKLAAAGELKAQGTTHARLYALPEQKFPAPASAPPQGGRKRAKKKGAAGKKKTRKPRRTTARATAPANGNAEFIAAVDAQMGLVLVGAGPQPLRFNVAQTSKIAELLFTHYEA